MDKNRTYTNLRNEFRYFCYEDFKLEISSSGLMIKFYFNLFDKFSFTPTIHIPKKNFFYDNINETELQNLAFHIGMIELISYWKAACPPELVIKPFKINKEQIKWWKKVYFFGLGEFFYTNGISTDIDSFMQISSTGPKNSEKFSFHTSSDFLLPVGGGKDSIVSLEVLSGNGNVIKPFILNPRGATLDTVKAAGFDLHDIITINRNIDSQLIELNKKGFLNGHTPFSALLAFVSLLGARMAGMGNIALSNESSANESTVPGSDVNHQYSKSFDFENDFRNYVRTHISGDFNYFSLLRPLNELQIAKIFSENPKYFPVFKSCNVGSKSDIWCGKCPKCLFTWIILSPFLDQQKLSSIFGRNLLNDLDLKHVFDELIGKAATKPFECVGTVEEINVALNVLLDKFQPKDSLPSLLQYYSNLDMSQAHSNRGIQQLIAQFETPNFVPQDIVPFLKTALI